MFEAWLKSAHTDNTTEVSCVLVSINEEGEREKALSAPIPIEAAQTFKDAHIRW